MRPACAQQRIHGVREGALGLLREGRGCDGRESTRAGTSSASPVRRAEDGRAAGGGGDGRLRGVKPLRPAAAFLAVAVHT